MKTRDQSVQRLALPPFLKKGLEANRVGKGEDQKYTIRSKWKNQTYEFQAWQFFILEVLPACNDYADLASVFKDRFGHTVKEDEVRDLIYLVFERGLFSEQAMSHPMVAAYKDPNTTLTTKPYRNELIKKERVKKNTEFATASVDKTVLDKDAIASPGLGFPSGAFGDTVESNGDENQSHLARALQKARKSAAFDHSSKNTSHAETTQAPIHRTADNRIVGKMTYSGTQTTSAMAIEPEPNRNMENDSQGNAVEKGSPAEEPAATGIDDRMKNRGWKLFNPGWLIRILYPLVSPLRHAIYFLPLMFIAALFIVARHMPVLSDDFQLLLFNTPFLKHAILSMVTVNLAVTLLIGVVAHGFRATVSAFCIVFYMYFFPRFMVRIGNVNQLLRRERIWLHAAPLLLRLAFFSVGILMWFNARTVYATLSSFSLTIALAGAASFLITVNPLIKSSGYYLLTAFINEPNLREKSYKALLNKFRGDVYNTADSNVLVAYALVSALYTLTVTAAMLYIFSEYLQVQLGPASILIIVLIATVLAWRTVKNFSKLEEAYERSIQFERWRNRTLPLQDNVTAEKEEPKKFAVYVRRSVLLLIVAVLMLPYKYEPGGNFIVLPNEQQTITAEIPGIIEKIDYDGGEFLKKGTVIGQLSYSDYSAQLRIYNAKIAQQQAVIDELKSKPRPEEVKMAQTALETQRTQAAFSKDKASRLQNLYKEGVVSLEDLENARRAYEVDLDQVQEKRANLELVKRGATPEELAEAEAKLQSFMEERDYYQEKIDQSVFHMPIDGKLITMQLKQKIGSYLNKGEPLAVAEQASQVQVEIEIPESDISYVKENNEIRCRFHVYHDEDFLATVKTIDANVTEENYGKVIKVRTALENADERIKSGMTGYAKISGEKMPLWKVLSLAIIRFIKVEVWSWLP